MHIIPGGPEVPRSPSSIPHKTESPKTADAKQEKAQEAITGVGKDFARVVDKNDLRTYPSKISQR